MFYVVIVAFLLWVGSMLVPLATDEEHRSRVKKNLRDPDVSNRREW